MAFYILLLFTPTWSSLLVDDRFSDCDGISIYPLADFGQESSPFFDMTRSFIASHNDDELKCSLTVLVGDIFYPCGVASVTDDRLHYLTSFGTPACGVFGNHDYYYAPDWNPICSGGNINAIINFAKESKSILGTSEWIMDDHNYYRVFALKNRKILAIFLDTHDTYSEKNRSVKFDHSIDSSIDWLVSFASTHRNFVDENIDETIVFGHNGMVTTGDHFPGTPKLFRLIDIFKQLKVGWYICGHDHINAHFELSSIDGSYSFNHLIAGNTVKVDPYLFTLDDALQTGLKEWFNISNQKLDLKISQYIYPNLKVSDTIGHRSVPAVSTCTIGSKVVRGSIVSCGFTRLE